MVKFTFQKRARVSFGLMTGAAFIALAVWGWGLPVETVIQFTLICLGLLLVIVAVAAPSALLWRRIKAQREPQYHVPQDQD